MLPTPCLDHVSKADWNKVYEPNSDTFLFLDALQQEREFIQQLNPSICLEIGSGSGAVITFLASMLGKNRLYFAVDINRDACRVTRSTIARNLTADYCFDNVNTDLVSGLNLNHKVDVLLFNPPYVPTTEEELGRTDIYAAWAGGQNGTSVLDRLYPELPRILSPKGVFYLVALAENNPKEIARKMLLLGFDVDIVARRKCANELLFILKFFRQKNE